MAVKENDIVSDLITCLTILYNKKEQLGLGIHSGTMGLIMSHFMTAAYLKDNGLYEKGTSLLEYLIDNISTCRDLSFENGLCGIGFGVEWLVRNNFIEANTNDLLADLDDEIWKKTFLEGHLNISLAAGSLGTALFFFSRINTQSPAISRFLRFWHHESLGVQQSNFKKMCKQWLPSLSLLNNNELNDLGHLLVFASKAVHTNVVFHSLQTIICQIVSGILVFLKEHVTHTLQKKDQYTLVLLSYALWCAGNSFRNEIWKSEGIAFITAPELHPTNDGDRRRSMLILQMLRRLKQSSPDRTKHFDPILTAYHPLVINSLRQKATTTPSDIQCLLISTWMAIEDPSFMTWDECYLIS